MYLYLNRLFFNNIVRSNFQEFKSLGMKLIKLIRGQVSISKAFTGFLNSNG